jgi:hypothetical protein
LWEYSVFSTHHHKLYLYSPKSKAYLYTSSRNVPPEFLDGMGSYSMSTSLYSHHHIGHRNGGQNGNPQNELPAQTIITNQPLSIQTISSTLQLEAKSTVEALIHQPTNTQYEFSRFCFFAKN